MKLYKSNHHLYLAIDNHWFKTQDIHFDKLINRKELHQYLMDQSKNWIPCPTPDFKHIDPPLNQQEIWAAGVTYMRSRTARMDESKDSGGSKFYDMVYYADRPELFYKGNRRRCVGHNQSIAIRKDSTWNVPEPELTLFVSSSKTIEGYTIGNDVSSRSIEGLNPLYLPQAKVYDRSSSLGPCLYIPDSPISPETMIKIKISRKNQIVYQEQISISKMKRDLFELVDYLFRDQRFPNGVFLMTGTCLVPDENFTLKINDQVDISIDGIGTLTNMVSI
ncbi:MAG: fumarylacetoacetate hydrolase family protein [Flavobacteriaceae bacterium]|nr:fumarylacetoacetate hydrolase family protein [Flavobacteriaceae bacterium]MCY4216516.1 fumarylacetoacetate hydrolase family protein [Flavobacteriaceae bacterium]MCY4254177.1 fumarylacetoacetate hydrolase family protein [Flavobacteriaceae bacterium]